MSAVLHADWPLTAPLLAVVPRHDVEAEPTPTYDAALATPAGVAFLTYQRRAYWILGPGGQPIEWRKGLRAACPRCDKVVAVVRTGGPVRHKFDGDWCTEPR